MRLEIALLALFFLVACSVPKQKAERIPASADNSLDTPDQLDIHDPDDE